jgi:hypothetical protein
MGRLVGQALPDGYFAQIFGERTFPQTEFFAPNDSSASSGSA